MLKVNSLVKKHVCTKWCDHAYILLNAKYTYVGTHGGCLVCKTVVIVVVCVCQDWLLQLPVGHREGGRGRD